MQLTSEQKAVLETDSDIVINAVAGSGKTTTLIEYAKTRPPYSKILYLAFNKTVKSEAVERFKAAGLTNIRVETAHSLAYDHIVKQTSYELVPMYQSHDLCQLLRVATGDRQTDFIVANHVNKFISLFCNGNATRVQDVNYAETLVESKSKSFVERQYHQIEKLTRTALARMDKAEIPMTHDFYLKKFQLISPKLSYDYILFDEGQDASPAMLDVFLKQKAVKLIVGDMHQQIYGWRYAINSLQQVNFKVHHLSHSFRFDEEIALVANKILGWKRHLSHAPAQKVVGAGKPRGVITSRATLGRTNIRLLLNAIAQRQHGSIDKLFFEGNISSYTFADEGASLYDVLHLFNGSREKIKHSLIAEMKSMNDLEEYIQKTEDNSLAVVVEVVKEFGNKLPGLIAELKTLH